MSAPVTSPRSAALLCALRRGPRSSDDLCDAIGDSRWSDTAALIDDMTRLHLVESRGSNWRLADAGRDWLLDHGIEVA